MFMAHNANIDVVNPLAPPPQDPSYIHGNVYHVHPSDGPLSVSITQVLTHSNDHDWVCSMHFALGAKDKFDFLDGMFPIRPLVLQ
jgi:hypothetical protein